MKMKKKKGFVGYVSIDSITFGSFVGLAAQTNLKQKGK